MCCLIWSQGRPCPRPSPGSDSPPGIPHPPLHQEDARHAQSCSPVEVYITVMLFFLKKCIKEFEIFGVFMENTALFEIIMDKQMKIYFYCLWVKKSCREKFLFNVIFSETLTLRCHAPSPSRCCLRAAQCLSALVVAGVCRPAVCEYVMVVCSTAALCWVVTATVAAQHLQ